MTMYENDQVIKKGWGSEFIVETNEHYSIKMMHFKHKGAQSSMHFHVEKLETWIVQSGEFDIEIINTTDADVVLHHLTSGAVITIYPLTPHRITCIEPGAILEVSTKDTIEDNFRVMKGDSQNAAQKDICV